MTGASGSIEALPAGAFGSSAGWSRAASRIFCIAIVTAAVWLGRANSPAGAPSRGETERRAASSATASGGHAVVVELFTSQGCSTCPPADRLLSKLGEQAAPRVVALAFHVDFWNHDGWTDPFSSREWTERQVAYARAFGLRQVYTPQAVIDGAAEFVGSDADRILPAIAAAAARPAGEISLRLEASASKVLVDAEVALPEALRGRKLEVLFAVCETGLVTSVEHGENGGSVLRDDYVVRSLRTGPRLEAGASGRARAKISLPLSKGWNPSRLGVAAFLQDPRSLEICGATSQSLAGASPTLSGGAR